MNYHKLKLSYICVLAAMAIQFAASLLFGRMVFMVLAGIGMGLAALGLYLTGKSESHQKKD
jgi:predicted branched-subunit amino acid permease